MFLIIYFSVNCNKMEAFVQIFLSFFYFCLNDNKSKKGDKISLFMLQITSLCFVYTDVFMFVRLQKVNILLRHQEPSEILLQLCSKPFRLETLVYIATNIWTSVRTLNLSSSFRCFADVKKVHFFNVHWNGDEKIIY